MKFLRIRDMIYEWEDDPSYDIAYDAYSDRTSGRHYWLKSYEVRDMWVGSPDSVRAFIEWVKSRDTESIVESVMRGSGHEE